MYRKILVPYDKSEPSQRALQEARKFLDMNPDAEITVLSVIEWHDYNAETFKIASRFAGVIGDDLDMNIISKVSEEAALEASAAVARDMEAIIGDDDRISVAIINGSAHDTITAYAERGDFDCIIMGHRGLGAVRGMLGSVCYSVLHKANMPVLIVK